LYNYYVNGGNLPIIYNKQRYDVSYNAQSLQ